MRRDLAGDEVLVRWLETEVVPDEHWLLMEKFLDDTERARAQRFHFEDDRRSYIAAHALLRATLCGLVGRAPADWRFSTDCHGKPEAMLCAHEPPLRVNLSHTRGLVAVAISLGSDIGIDVEWMQRGNLTRELGLKIFAPMECEVVAACDAQALNETLFAFWTLKEAYIKAVGKGLSMPLDSFAFSLDPLSIAFPDSTGENPAEWCFRRWRPTPEHAMALAIRRETLPHLVIERTVSTDLLPAGDQSGRGSGRISRR